MYATIEKWQASAIILSIVAAVAVLAALEKIDADTAASGLIGLGNLVLGAGAVAHGVRQGSKATADPPPTE